MDVRPRFLTITCEAWARLDGDRVREGLKKYGKRPKKARTYSDQTIPLYCSFAVISARLYIEAASSEEAETVLRETIVTADKKLGHTHPKVTSAPLVWPVSFLNRGGTPRPKHCFEKILRHTSPRLASILGTKSSTAST